MIIDECGTPGKISLGEIFPDSGKISPRENSQSRGKFPEEKFHVEAFRSMMVMIAWPTGRCGACTAQARRDQGVTSMIIDECGTPGKNSLGEIFPDRGKIPRGEKNLSTS